MRTDIHGDTTIEQGGPKLPRVRVEQKPFSVSYQWCDASVVAYQTVSGVTYHS